MAVTWSAFAPDIMPHVPGCPLVVIEHEVRRAAQHLLRTSRAWQATTTVRAVDAGDDFLALTPLDANEQETVRVESAWYDGTRLEVASRSDMDNAHTDDWQAHTGTPTHIIQMTPGYARLYPIPEANAETGIKYLLSLMPSNASTGLPDEYASRYMALIATGAKANLMLYPNEAWTNLELGAALMKLFESGVSSLISQAAVGFGTGRLRANPTWC